jgi:hypothetical protein
MSVSDQGSGVHLTLIYFDNQPNLGKAQRRLTVSILLFLFVLPLEIRRLETPGTLIRQEPDDRSVTRLA